MQQLMANMMGDQSHIFVVQTAMKHVLDAVKRVIVRNGRSARWNLERANTNDVSLDLYQAFMSWNVKAKDITKGRLIDHFKLIEIINHIGATQLERKEILHLFNIYKQIERNINARSNQWFPSKGKYYGKTFFASKLDDKGIDLQGLAEPEFFENVLERFIIQQRRNGHFYDAMDAGNFFISIFRDEDSLPFLSEEFRAFALAQIARESAWVALQAESLPQLINFQSVSRKAAEGSCDAAVLANHYTNCSYVVRLKCMNSQYPNKDFARAAFRASNALRSKFRTNFKTDPLVGYNAANELRLLGHSMQQRADVFEERSVAQQMVLTSEWAGGNKLYEENARIKTSLARGFLNDNHLNEAIVHIEDALKDVISAGRPTSSYAHVLDVKGLIELSAGDLRQGYESVEQAMRIYLSIGAFKRLGELTKAVNIIKEGALSSALFEIDDQI